MKINQYSCMGFFQILYPHKSDINNRFIPQGLRPYLKYNKEGNVCGHIGKVPIEYKNDYMKLRMLTIWRFLDEVVLFRYVAKIRPEFLSDIICVLMDIIEWIIDWILVLYYWYWHKKMKGKYFKECYLLKTNTTVEFGEK